MTVPGLVMLAVGLLLVCRQLAGPVSLGFTNLDIHYMILGVTLSLVGTSATSLGLVVGAMMPAGRAQAFAHAEAAHRRYSFDAAALIAGLLFATGSLTASSCGYWLYHIAAC